MQTPSPGKLLRTAVAGNTIPIPGAFNALVGKLIESAGFDAVYLSGAALSAGVLALPDVGLFSLTELVTQATYLTRSVKLPVVVDADTGFGGAVQVERTVRELEAAGVAAIQLEDQQLPKRCGHLSGKSLIDADEMCAKLRSAAAARTDSDLVLIARTDARGVENLDAALERAKRYLDSGADWIFPEALTDRKEFERFADEIEAPLVANMTEFGKSPLLSLDELADMGYAAVLYPVSLMRVAMRAVEAALAMIASEGSQRELLDLMQSREDLYELLGYKDFEERDQHHFRATTGEPPPNGN